MPSDKILITRPSYEDTTAYLSKWSGEILSAAKSRGKTIIDLYGARANRREFESCLHAHDPEFVILNGHGADDCVTGHKEEPLLKSGDNDGLANSRIVYALSCNSAAKLGADCVANGARAYVGYGQAFVFVIDASRSVMPLQDSLARPFFESANAVPLSLIKGNSVGESVEKSRQTFQKNIEHFQTHTSVESPHIVAFLRWDLAVQKMHGDGAAALT